MNSKGLFLTGTGTDIGKTVTAGFLLTLLQSLHIPALYYKPVQCGPAEWQGKGFPGGDCQVIREIFGHPNTACTWALRTPASPHLAFAMENHRYDSTPVLQTLSDARKSQTFTLMEGAGGVRVPLDDRNSMLDLMRLAGFPALVTASPRLGTINHTLLTIESLKHHQIPVVGFVFSGKPDPENEALTADNAHSIARHGGVPFLGSIPDARQGFTEGNWQDHPLRALLMRVTH